jgi:hypothetical protein
MSAELPLRPPSPPRYVAVVAAARALYLRLHQAGADGYERHDGCACGGSR